MTTTKTKREEVIEKILALRKYTQETGFFTTRSQNELLQTLDGDDPASALLELNRKLTEAKMTMKKFTRRPRDRRSA